MEYLLKIFSNFEKIRSQKFVFPYGHPSQVRKDQYKKAPYVYRNAKKFQLNGKIRIIQFEVKFDELHIILLRDVCRRINKWLTLCSHENFSIFPANSVVGRANILVEDQTYNFHVWFKILILKFIKLKNRLEDIVCI